VLDVFLGKKKMKDALSNVLTNVYNKSRITAAFVIFLLLVLFEDYLSFYKK
jgi:hypothetical protein